MNRLFFFSSNLILIKKNQSYKYKMNQIQSFQRVCLDSTKSECHNEFCDFKHLSEGDLINAIKTYSYLIEKECFSIINSTGIMLSLFNEIMTDSNILLLCLKEFLKHSDKKIKTLKIEFFHLFHGDLPLYAKTIKKFLRFEFLENLSLQFIGKEFNYFDEIRLNPIKIYAEKLKRLNSFTLVIGKGIFKETGLKEFFLNFNETFKKLKSFQMILLDSVINHLFFFEPLFNSNLAKFSIDLSHCLILQSEENNDFIKGLFEGVSNLDIKNLVIKQKDGNQTFKISLKDYNLEIEFGGLDHFLINKFEKIFKCLMTFKMIKSIRLELNPSNFYDYTSLSKFLKRIPQEFLNLQEFALKFPINGKHFKCNQKINNLLKIIQRWIIGKKHMLYVLNMAKFYIHFRTEILYNILNEYFNKN